MTQLIRRKPKRWHRKKLKKSMDRIAAYESVDLNVLYNAELLHLEKVNDFRLSEWLEIYDFEEYPLDILYEEAVNNSEIEKLQRVLKEMRPNQ